jgi:hypothetical protein
MARQWLLAAQSGGDVSRASDGRSFHVAGLGELSEVVVKVGLAIGTHAFATGTAAGREAIERVLRLLLRMVRAPSGMRLAGARSVVECRPLGVRPTVGVRLGRVREAGSP